MRTRIQFIEKPEIYYSKLWKIPQVWLKELLEVYRLNKDIWKYKKYKQWFERSYKFKISWRQWKRFKRYCKNYNRRKDLKLRAKVYVNWEE